MTSDEAVRYLQVFSSKGLKLGATKKQIQLAVWAGPGLAVHWYASDNDDDDDDGGMMSDDDDDDDDDDQGVSVTNRSESMCFQLNCTAG